MSGTDAVRDAYLAAARQKTDEYLATLLGITTDTTDEED